MLQRLLIAHLAVRESIPAEHIQRLTIRQLGMSQRLKLGGVRMQFQLGSDDLFQAKQYAITDPCVEG